MSESRKQVGRSVGGRDIDDKITITLHRLRVVVGGGSWLVFVLPSLEESGGVVVRSSHVHTLCAEEIVSTQPGSVCFGTVGACVFLGAW